MIKNSLNIKSIKIADLKPAEYNPRQSTERQEKALSESLKKFGCVEPVIVNIHTGRENTIIGGHFRVRELKKLGYKEVDCVIVDLSLEAEKELNIRLNANTGEWNFELLESNFEIENLTDWGLDINFDLQDQDLLDKTEKEDEIPELPKEAKTRFSDLWTLGNHTLLCGDSTKEESYKKLLNSSKVDLTFTSPPYNASKDKYINEEANKISEFNVFLKTFTELCLKNSLDVLVNIQLLQTNKLEFFKYLIDLNKELKNTFIWNKKQGQPCPAKNTVILFTEFIFHFNNKDNGTIGTKEFQTIPNIVEISRSNGGNNQYANIHNAVFPEALPIYFIENLVKNKGSVLEPFCGTGTTLIACEKLNRKCFAIELTPLYCDVIIERWQNLTNKEAVRSDGIKFNEVNNGK